MRARVLGVVIAAVAVANACRPAAPDNPPTKPEGSASSTSVALDAALADDAAAKDALAEAGARLILDAGLVRDGGGAADGDAAEERAEAMKLHRETKDELLSLFTIKDFTEDEKKRILPEHFLRGAFGVDGPGHMNQGNKAIAQHTISREKCLAGLKDVVIQTPEQKAKCGAENMVPVWLAGKDPWFCIDVFEFPNKACELPMVWTPPTWAKKVCELQGKRLCSDTEWNIACRGDPAGGADSKYAYGEKLDLEVCNTDQGHRQPCVVRDAKSTWNTCTTDTEPSGSFPKCKSRFGVYDQHGNVAEVMMRREGDHVVTQLKGSAWFYKELAKEPNQPTPTSTPNKTGAYPDHCNFDPRWHVEPIENAWHVNYHLGFRCCKSIP